MLTFLNQKVVFKWLTRPKRSLLKQKVLWLRNIHCPDVFSQVTISTLNDFETLEISIDQNLIYIFELGQNGCGSKISKSEKNEQDVMSTKVLQVSEWSKKKAVQNFIKNVINRKGNVIKSLEFECTDSIIGLFEPLSVEITSLSVRTDPSGEISGHLEVLKNIKNLMSLHVSTGSLSEEFLEKFKNLHELSIEVTDLSKIDVLRLENPILKIKDSRRTFQYFLCFLKKLHSGAHLLGSFYQLSHFKDRKFSSEHEFISEIAHWLQQLDAQAHEATCQVKCSSSSLTIPIGNNLILRVNPNKICARRPFITGATMTLHRSD